MDMKSNLKSLMESAGMTEVRLSNLTGMTQENINRLKNTPRDPKLSSALRIARALRVPVEKIWTLPEQAA